MKSRAKFLHNDELFRKNLAARSVDRLFDSNFRRVLDEIAYSFVDDAYVYERDSRGHVIMRIVDKSSVDDSKEQ